MNDTLQNALAEILLRAVETAESASEFVLAELPDVAQQLLRWHMVHSLIIFFFGAMLLALGIILYKYLKPRNAEGFEYVPLIAGSIVGSVIMLVNITWVKILIAPKLYLLEYAMRLLK